MGNLTNAVFDVDGVFTDGSFLYDESGKKFKRFGAHDSDGLKLLKEHNFKMLAITADARGFDISNRRLQDMGVKLELVRENNRFEFISQRFDLGETVFVADGIWDAKLLSVCKLGIAPANATNFAKSSADIILKRKGGDGAVLEAVEIILNYNHGEDYWTNYLLENW